MHESNVTGHFYFLMCKKKKIFLFVVSRYIKELGFIIEQSFMINTGTLAVKLWSPPTQLIYILSIVMIKSRIQYHLITGALAKAKV